MQRKVNVSILCVIALLGCLLLTSCSKQEAKWNQPPKIDLDSLPHIEISAEAATMEIEENGETLEFKIIRTFEDLDDIRNDKEEDLRIRKNYIMANDIDFMNLTVEDRYFRSIRANFVGIFNGNNYQIKHLKFLKEYYHVPGSLFQYIGDHLGQGGIVKNLITFGNAFAPFWAAPIAYDNNGIIENCINFADVADSGATAYGGKVERGGLGFGGIAVRNAESGIIRNCINYGQIGALNNNDSSVAGGIVGNNHGIIENCINYGTILGNRNIGGIAGSTVNSEIKNCANYGTVIGVDVDEDSGIVGVLASMQYEPRPDKKPVDNINYGLVIVIKNNN